MEKISLTPHQMDIIEELVHNHKSIMKTKYGYKLAVGGSPIRKVNGRSVDGLFKRGILSDKEGEGIYYLSDYGRLAIGLTI